MEESLAHVSKSLNEQAAGDRPKKQKNRKEKPWDTPDIDKWKTEKFTQEHNPHGLLEESSFATLFPQYREQYLKQVWPDVKAACDEHGIRAELDLVEGSMTVKTTKKTFDPFIIIKARDLLKLLARSVPFPQAVKILEDDMHCDVMKIKSYVRSKEKFVKRRQRLVGPNGSTLRALELLTECYLLVQGQTCCIMGPAQRMKQVRRIVEDCFRNIHPVYHVKELMIKQELEKDPELKDQDWDRFLPKFKKRNIQSKKLKKKAKKQKSLFPPEQTPRKEDLQMESGEYFLTEQQRQQKKDDEKRLQRAEKTVERKRKREEAFTPSAEHFEAAASKKAKVDEPTASGSATAASSGSASRGADDNEREKKTSNGTKLKKKAKTAGAGSSTAPSVDKPLPSSTGGHKGSSSVSALAEKLRMKSKEKVIKSAKSSLL
mmetsp:Transcript_22136/g.55830  ORF Transcript_22136/g.55830 Transcript_22136/m.55830 type:complete len:431 (+) Transcript_22136:77-1369(+)